MRVSERFRRFFFGRVIPEIKKAPQPLKFQNPFTLEWDLIDFEKVSDDAVYHVAKMLNPDYPKLKGLYPASTTALTNKHLTRHIQWIERWLSQNGHTCKHIEEEWDKIIQEAGIEK